MSDILKRAVVSSAKNRLRWREPLRLFHDNVPTVDVLLPCCKEDLDVILDTVKACVKSDYPRDRFRVFVLDDGKSNEVAQSVKDVQSSTSVEIIYGARERKDKWLKAANLNFGLELADKTARGPSDFVTVLDIDMIPEPGWLRALVPHLLRDEQLAMISAPQRFYNIPRNSNVITHIDPYMDFFAIIQDSLNSTYCTGSGFVARRSALDSVGGFATESIQDDILISLHLRAKGWKMAFVQEDQQYGQRPSTLGSFAKQWIRWMVGAINMVMILRSPKLQSLPAEQRRIGSTLMLSRVITTFSIAGSVMGVLLILYIYKGQPFVFHDSSAQLSVTLGLALMDRTLNSLYDYYVARSTGFRMGMVPHSDIWLTPYQIQGLVIPVLEYLGVPERFAAAGTQLKDADPTGKPLMKRLKLVVWNSNAWMHLLYIVSLAVALVSAILCCSQNRSLEMLTWKDMVSPTMLSSLLYPPFLQLVYICFTQSWAPIRYALSPVEVAERESLLIRDEKTGVAYPTEEAKDLDRKVAFLGHGGSFAGILACFALAPALAMTSL